MNRELDCYLCFDEQCSALVWPPRWTRRENRITYLLSRTGRSDIIMETWENKHNGLKCVLVEFCSTQTFISSRQCPARINTILVTVSRIRCIVKRCFSNSSANSADHDETSSGRRWGRESSPMDCTVPCRDDDSFWPAATKQWNCKTTCWLDERFPSTSLELSKTNCFVLYASNWRR